MARKTPTKNRKEARCNRCNKWMRKDNLKQHQGNCIMLQGCIWTNCEEKVRTLGHADKCKEAPWLQCPSCYRMKQWRSRHNPAKCSDRIRTQSAMTCRDELGWYEAEPVDPLDIWVSHGRYLDAPLRELYLREASQYIFLDISTKKRRAIKMTSKRVTKKIAIQTDLEGYVTYRDSIARQYKKRSIKTTKHKITKTKAE